MSRQRNVISGRMWKIFVVCLAVVALAVAVPTAVLATTGDGKAAVVIPASDRSTGGLSQNLYAGDWTQTERWGSLLTGGASGPGLRTSTVAPVPFYDEMESGSSKWTATGTWAITEEWSADSPTNAWDDSPGGPVTYSAYDSSGRTIATAPIDLTEARTSGQRVFVLFNCYVDLEPPYWAYPGWSFTEGLNVLIGGGGTGESGSFDILTGDPYGPYEGFYALEIPSAYMYHDFRLSLRVFSEGTSGRDGVYIDDVAILVEPNQSVEQTDTGLTYLGNWGYSASGSASGGSFNYTTTPGAALNINFTGTGLTWYGKTGPGYGLAYVSVDGSPAEEVDFYSPVTSFQEGVYDTGNLTDAAHTLAITYAGEKNPASSGNLVNVDAFDVWGTLTQAPVPARFQQNDPDLAYTGAWATTATSLASGLSFASVDAPGSSVNVTFDGTYLAWYAPKGPGYGKAQVTLDAGTPDEVTTMVDFYSASTLYKQRVYNTGLLKVDGPHTLSIYWAGEKNAAAYGTRIAVDAFDVFDDLTTASAAPPILWRYQQSDTRLGYLGNWSAGSSWSASGGTFNYTAAPGAAVVVNFTGTSVTLLATKGPGYGKIITSFDGGTPEVIDLYNPTTLYKQPVYSNSGLSMVAHTLTVKCAPLADKNPASSGSTVNLDAVDITGYLTQTPVPGRYQQNDVRFRYTGAWAPTSTSLASGYSFASVEAPGSTVKVAFSGNYLAWYATMGPGYGKAQVSLDGGTPFLVDFYSSYTKYKQRIYNTGLLEDTSHTLTIYWIGQKNPAAYGTRISVDAFDISGFVEPVIIDAEPLVWRYQQNDSKLAYVGAWSSAASWSASGGSFNYTANPGAAVLVNFTGDSVTLLGTKGPGYGQARVAVNGDWSTAELVDFYDATTKYKQVVYTKTFSSSEARTLAIRCIGDHQEASTGNTISLDALDTGYLTPAITRYQEDNTFLKYEGTWTPTATWSASGGSLTSANVSGAKLTIVFTGSYLALYAKTAPWNGIAKVTLDGGAPFDVDLYSSAQTYKKLVYNTGVRPTGEHTLVIEWSGTKRAASSGTGINIDAFDVAGTLKAVPAP